MPVLPQEPSVSPGDLFSPDFQQSLESGVWWALHTRPRAEKSLARRLAQHEIAFFLPLHEKSRRQQRRWIRSRLPLFPSYLFLFGAEDARRRALETNLVVNCLAIQDQARVASDLFRLHELIESGMSVFPEERLRPGMRAQIASGPLSGMCGTVIRCGRTRKFVVEVDFLQQGASVELDASLIEPV
jgi:transcriptional antiterminator RfaH